MPTTDGSVFADAVAALHPDPFASITEREFAAAARSTGDDLVSLMRLAASLGPRNGHTAIFADDDHTTPLRFFPLRLYEFAEGLHVVAAQDNTIVGSELLAIDGVPIDDVAQAVTPLVSGDNEWSVRDRRPVAVVACEVLAELGIAGERASFRLRGRKVVLEASAGALPPEPTVAPVRVEVLDGGVVHVAYNATRPVPDDVLRQVAGQRRVILDLRRNAGGDNRTYGPLLDALERAGNELRVLISRRTFSAAMQLIVDLERTFAPTFYGEPTGGSPNQYGDARRLILPASGLRARVATVAWTTAGDDPRLAVEPHVAVPATAADHFAGRDAVLEAARR
jgi:hypothetical protein